jgi:hypothetical protein
LPLSLQLLWLEYQIVIGGKEHKMCRKRRNRGKKPRIPKEMETTPSGSMEKRAAEQYRGRAASRSFGSKVLE